MGDILQLSDIVTLTHWITELCDKLKVHNTQSTIHQVNVKIQSRVQSLHVLCSLIQVFQYVTDSVSYVVIELLCNIDSQFKSQLLYVITILLDWFNDIIFCFNTVCSTSKTNLSGSTVSKLFYILIY